MESKYTEVICGNGTGKTAMAVGKSLQAAVQGQSVIIIQFLKGKERQDVDFLEGLSDQDIKIFRFERMEQCYAELTPEEQEEENLNIRNGVNFARKVIATGECDCLVLDEILGLVDKEIIKAETIRELLTLKDPCIHIILTGRNMPESLRDCVDAVTRVETELTQR